jgi:hypothetical protein
MAGRLIAARLIAALIVPIDVLITPLFSRRSKPPNRGRCRSMAKTNPTLTKSIPGYAPRLNKSGAIEYFCKEHFPISPRQAERMFASLPRVYVGRSPLFETAAIADLANRLIEQAPSIAGNVPIPNRRKRSVSK